MTRKPRSPVRIILIYQTLAINYNILLFYFKHSTIHSRQQFPEAFLCVVTVTQNENASLHRGALCNNTNNGFMGD